MLTLRENLSQSKLIQLPSGQLIGNPITRRQLKRTLRESRLHRRSLYRAAKRMGLSYTEAHQLVTQELVTQ